MTILSLFKHRRTQLVDALKGKPQTVDLDAEGDQTDAARLSLYRDGGPVDCGSPQEATRRLRARRACAVEISTAVAREGAPELVRRRTRNASRLERELVREIDFMLALLDSYDREGKTSTP